MLSIIILFLVILFGSDEKLYGHDNMLLWKLREHHDDVQTVPLGYCSWIERKLVVVFDSWMSLIRERRVGRVICWRSLHLRGSAIV